MRKNIQRLEAAAGERRSGSLKRESDKAPHTDKGYTGARAARQMKRALAAEHRAEKDVQSRKETLADVEKSYPLKLSIADSRTTSSLVKASNLVVLRGARLFQPISFELGPHDRLAVLGPNGCGKTSLLDLICGGEADTPGCDLEHQGVMVRHTTVEISRVRQQPLWSSGDLRERLADAGIDEGRFRQVMASLGVRGSLLERPIESLSHGQQKKIELARSVMTPANLLVWDEPLNFIDIDSRELIEAALIEQAPAMIFVEHDAAFVERVATQSVGLTRP